MSISCSNMKVCHLRRQFPSGQARFFLTSAWNSFSSNWTGWPGQNVERLGVRTPVVETRKLFLHYSVGNKVNTIPITNVSSNFGRFVIKIKSKQKMISSMFILVYLEFHFNGVSVWITLEKKFCRRPRVTKKQKVVRKIIFRIPERNEYWYVIY